MPTVTYNDESYTCTIAFKGEDYIHLMDSNGLMIAAFDGVTDFSGFGISDGNWVTPSPANDCVAIVNEDSTISNGGKIANSVVLTAAGWSDNLQTVALAGMTGSKNIVVSPAPASHVAYGEASVYCSAQADGSLTFTSDDAPTSNLTVNVLVIGG